MPFNNDINDFSTFLKVTIKNMGMGKHSMK